MNIGVDGLSLLQGNFLTQESNWDLLGGFFTREVELTEKLCYLTLITQFYFCSFNSQIVVLIVTIVYLTELS